MSKTINNLSKDLKDLVNHFDLVDYDGSADSVDEIFDKEFNNMKEGINNITNSINNLNKSFNDMEEEINNLNRYINIKDQITFLNNWHYWGNEERFGAYIVGNVVHINILLNPNANNLAQYTTIFKINDKYKPIIKEFIPCITNKCIMVMGCLDTDGTFSFEHAINADTNYVSINLTYPIRI